MLNKPQDPRRLLVLFAITTLVPAASLLWIGWRMVHEDRELAGKRILEKRDQAGDLAAASLQRIIAETEDKLTTLAAAPDTPADLRDGAALVVFSRDSLRHRAGTPLLYYPAIPSGAQPQSPRLAEADNLELHKNDLPGALRLLYPLAAGSDPALRAEATLRVARIQRKLGNVSKALDAFAQLGKAGEIRVSGLPAGLTAHQARALLFEAAGRTRELQSEAAAICDSLESGRWLVTRAEFTFAYEQARGWLGKTRPPLAPERLAAADAAESLWQEWRIREDQQAAPRGRRTFHSGSEDVLVLTRSSPERLTAMLIGRQFLQTSWLDPLRSSSAGQGVEFALTDADGRAVLGHPELPLALQSVRPASATQLPWTVHAISAATALPAPELSGRTRLLLAGIALMAVIVLAGGYFINRAVLREITVARLQSDFVAAVSHEFRTPLTTLRQLSEMLVRGRISTDERRQQFYTTLLRESERLHRLVEGLLNFGAMEAGKLQYRFEPLDPTPFLRELVSDFEREVSGLGYHVELSGNGALPPIRADRESLARVFWNLLDNAVKYSPENRTVWVDLSDAGKRLAVRVRDRGLGIPAAEQKEIFRKFVRGAASKSASIRGTGVGLAIARQIVAAHGGDISVESEPGEGSVFTVLLPVAET